MLNRKKRNTFGNFGLNQSCICWIIIALNTLKKISHKSQLQFSVEFLCLKLRKTVLLPLIAKSTSFESILIFFFVHFLSLSPILLYFLFLSLHHFSYVALHGCFKCAVSVCMRVSDQPGREHFFIFAVDHLIIPNINHELARLCW